tara:strand:- start:161 stop:367 length:207 start_codon:yes stop_codon:yes gene_type:complete
MIKIDQIKVYGKFQLDLDNPVSIEITNKLFAAIIEILAENQEELKPFLEIKLKYPKTDKGELPSSPIQ